MSTKQRISTVVTFVMLFVFLLAGNAVQAPTAQAAAASVVTINHYENGKVVGTHIVSDAWYAFAIRAGYWGERLDELYHFCQKEENQNNPKCRHAL